MTIVPISNSFFSLLFQIRYCPSRRRQPSCRVRYRCSQLIQVSSLWRFDESYFDAENLKRSRFRLRLKVIPNLHRGGRILAFFFFPSYQQLFIEVTKTSRCIGRIRTTIADIIVVLFSYPSKRLCRFIRSSTMSDADKPEGIPEGEREPEHETAASEEVGLL